MSNKTYNSQEDYIIKQWVRFVWKWQRIPMKLFMNINDTERRKKVCKKAIPNGNQHLNYGGDPILTVIGYYTQSNCPF